MNHMFSAFLNWVKDPFGRKHIVKTHTPVLQDIHTVTVLTEHTKEHLVQTHKKQRRRAVRHVGANPIDQSVLGTYKPQRKRT